MTATITPYRSGQQAGHDGFAQLLRAEWTKFRTMRGWVITLLAAAAAAALAPIALAGTAKSNDPMTCVHGQCQVEASYVATGPDGEAVTDSFYFVHQPLAGNGSLTVRVTSPQGSGPLAVRVPPLPAGPAHPAVGQGRDPRQGGHQAGIAVCGRSWPPAGTACGCSTTSPTTSPARRALCRPRPRGGCGLPARVTRSPDTPRPTAGTGPRSGP